MKTVHIASAANAAYFPGLEVLVASTLLHTARDVAVHFHIFDDGIDVKDWESLARRIRARHSSASIHRLRFPEERLGEFPRLNGNKATYARLFLGECLPQVEKVIYLDSDILIGRDIQELMAIDLAGSVGLATDDALFKRLSDDCPWLPAESSNASRYFNSGVLVLDLNQWRELDVLTQCLVALSTSPVPCRFYDQTALNYVLRDKIGLLPQVYNQFAFFTKDLPQVAANYHVVSAKPWLTHAHRFDHYLWRAFYEELIDAEKIWAEDAPLTHRIFNRLPFHRATRWLFIAIMRVLIARANHPHQRQMREESLRTALESPPFLLRARAAWRELDDAQAAAKIDDDANSDAQTSDPNLAPRTTDAVLALTEVN